MRGVDIYQRAEPPVTPLGLPGLKRITLVIRTRAEAAQCAAVAQALHALPGVRPWVITTDFAEMRPYNAASRTLLPDGDIVPTTDLEPDRRFARKLAQNGYVDVAWHLYQQSQATELLRPTGTDGRIDQAWVSGPLADAVSDYRVLDQPKGAPTPRPRLLSGDRPDLPRQPLGVPLTVAP